MELSNALKSLLATLTTKTMAADTDGVMLCDLTPNSANNPAPNGKMTMSSLLNTLAGSGTSNAAFKVIAYSALSGNANNASPGTITIIPNNSGISNLPDGNNVQQGTLITAGWAADRKMQTYIMVRGGVFARFYNGVWTEWTLTSTPEYLRPYANLAALTSAVYKGQWYGDCTTAADTAAKTCTISGFLAVPTSVVTVHFASAINVVASTLNGTTATLNISSTGAKPILYKGVPVQPGVVRAGNLVTMQYDGTNYNIIGIEGLESSAVPSNLYVDMGLPSGTLWATRNIDITQPNGFAASEYQYECSFFSWGNTDGHNPTSSASFSPYDWGSANDGPYASTPGSKIMGQLSPSQDFARANCGAPWRLPTTADFAELFANIEYIDAQGSVIASSTTDKRTTMNSITGLRIRSTVNGNIIFFPCSGYGYGASWGNRGANGYYWSSSLNSATNGRFLFFYSGGVLPQYNNNRFNGFAARPVQ